MFSLTHNNGSFVIYRSEAVVEASTMENESRAAVLQDLRIQSFDTIRFASYRTACKLRYVQKATNCELKTLTEFELICYLLFRYLQCILWTFGM